MSALALLLALTAPLVARAADDATVALNFQDVELPVLAKFVSEVTGRNFILDDRVHGKVTIISPTRITPDEAYTVFQSVLQVKGFTTVPSGQFTKIVPARDARETAVSSGGAAGAAGDELVTRVLSLRHAEATALLPVLQPLVSKDGVITAHAGTNRLVVVDAGTNVERLARLLRDLDVPQTQRPAQLHVYRLKYADSESLVRVLAQLLGLPVPPPPASRPHGSSLSRRDQSSNGNGGHGYGMGYDGGAGEPPPAPANVQPASTGGAPSIPLEAPVRLTADPATNALIVSATPSDWATLADVIADLDVRRRQVFVEAIILEATLDKTRSLGIELQGAVSLGDNAAGFGQVNLGTLAGAASDPTSIPGLILAAASNQKVTLPSGQEVPAHTVLLHALQSDTDLDVLSAPNIVTTDNEQAEIVVGRNVPFVASRATSSSNLTNLFTTVERHDVGITLRLQPQITADDYVRLGLFEEVSDIDPIQTAAGDATVLGPTTTIRSASTVVAARDGQTIVIGGLLADTVRGTQNQIPYLGHIPVLGALFRNNVDRRTKTNLLVFLTPHIIATDRQMADNAERQRDQMPSHVRRSPALRNRPWEPQAP
jgi:general secretion pathway protein D